MAIDPAVAVAGLIVGFVIGMTGMGGGALMTPVLVLVFGVKPLAAVSSDLVASLVMKPFGSAVHLRRRTVDWGLVRWLMIGSVPAAFVGVLLIRVIGGEQLQSRVQIALGVALVVAASALIARLLMDSYRNARPGAAGSEAEPLPGALPVAKGRTLLLGALGGLLVGMTSTGSGTVIIVGLMTLYPVLSMRRLVGTDLVQAVPLVGAAALGHVLFGEFELGLTVSLLIGAIPGVLLGARVSSRAPDLLVRPVMAVVLTGTALKLLGVPTLVLGLVMLAMAVIGFPLWALFDAGLRPAGDWAAAGLPRRRTLAVQAAGIPVAIGVVSAVVYFARLRPRLRSAAAAPPTAALPAAS